MTDRRASARGLVDRVGGRDRLREILDTFYKKLFDDLLVGFFFAGHDRAAIVDGQLAFLLWAFGAEPTLRGRHPKDAHGALAPILRGHFDRRIKVLRETLFEAGLGRDDIAAWLRVERSMRGHLVSTEGDPRSG